MSRMFCTIVQSRMCGRCRKCLCTWCELAVSVPHCHAFEVLQCSYSTALMEELDLADAALASCALPHVTQRLCSLTSENIVSDRPGPTGVPNHRKEIDSSRLAL